MLMLVLEAKEKLMEIERLLSNPHPNAVERARKIAWDMARKIDNTSITLKS